MNYKELADTLRAAIVATNIGVETEDQLSAAVIITVDIASGSTAFWSDLDEESEIALLSNILIKLHKRQLQKKAN